jgi:hypothetical protein
MVAKQYWEPGIAQIPKVLSALSEEREGSGWYQSQNLVIVHDAAFRKLIWITLQGLMYCKWMFYNQPYSSTTELWCLILGTYIRG